MAEDIENTATEPPPETIGAAHMDENGVITLRLRATAPGITGDATLTYAPGDEQYAAILSHLNGLLPGQSKLVPPWPDQE